jgi:hypothetical protein
MQILIAAYMISIGVGVVYGPQFPRVCIKYLPHLSARVLIVTAVNEAYFTVIKLYQTDFGGTLYIIAVSRDLNQFVHIICPLRDRIFIQTVCAIGAQVILSCLF